MQGADVDSRLDDLCLSLQANGCAVSVDLPPQDWSAILYQLAGRLGCCRTYFGQPEVMDIKPTKNCGSMSFGGTSEFPLHTDLAWYARPPRYLAMFCMDPGQGGGHALYADGLGIVNQADTHTRAAWKERPVFFPAPGHVDAEGFTAPIVTVRGGHHLCRFNTRDIWDRLDGGARAFADRLTEATRRVTLRPGHLLVYDNWRFCHGRTEIHRAQESTRWLKRMYIDVD